MTSSNTTEKQQLRSQCEVETLDLLSNLTIDSSSITDILTNQDKNSIELLNQLDVYLTKYEALNKKMVDGFIDLKRANYASFDSHRFGKDCWDLRLCLASKNLKLVGAGGGADNNGDKAFELCDLIKEKKELQVLEKKNKEKSSTAAPTTKSNSKPTPTTTTTSNSESIKINETTVKNRKSKTTTTPSSKNTKTQNQQSTTNEEEDEEEMILRNPIQMFNGGFVPLALRQSKKSFDSCLSDMLELVDLKAKVLDIVQKLEKV